MTRTTLLGSQAPGESPKPLFGDYNEPRPRAEPPPRLSRPRRLAAKTPNEPKPRSLSNRLRHFGTRSTSQRRDSTQTSHATDEGPGRKRTPRSHDGRQEGLRVPSPRGQTGGLRSPEKSTNRSSRGPNRLTDRRRPRDSPEAQTKVTDRRRCRDSPEARTKARKQLTRTRQQPRPEENYGDSPPLFDPKSDSEADDNVTLPTRAQKKSDGQNTRRVVERD
jgi:hypothetical protein